MCARQRNLDVTQLNLFAEEDRLAKLSAIGDNLEKIIATPINWGRFTERLDKELSERRGLVFDGLTMLKVWLLQNWYGLSDEEAEFEINDRLSFQRFLGLCLSSGAPDRDMIRGFREGLSDSESDNEIYQDFIHELLAHGIVSCEDTRVCTVFVRQQNSGRGTRH